MNRSLRDSLFSSGGGGPAPTNGFSHRRRNSLSSKDSSHDYRPLDLFSRSRRSLSIPSSDDSSDEVSVKLGRLSLESTRPIKIGLDDLLSSSDGGKHDYDWLLTPPGTPLFPTSDENESQTAPLATRSSSLPRSVSTSTTTKASRLSVSQSSVTSNRPKPTRSSSVTRTSLSTSQYSTHSNKPSSILNTSSASVSSYIRPSTPSRSSSTSRPSTPSSRPTLSRSSTPSKARPMPNATSAEKVRPSQNSRPSTPTSRPQLPANLNSPAARSTSRPSTPTRRNPAPSSSPASGPSSSVGRSLQNGRTVASISRPNSPSPRVRATQQPIVFPDFPLETPPNLRTTLPDRPLSAGRSRPGAAVSFKGNVENQGAANLQRRQSSPITTRGRLPDTSARSRVTVNGQLSHNPESHRAPHGSESSTRKPLKTSADSTGFGRTISKKSLDMAIKHMDIRNGSNGIRPLSGSTLFPQSLRSGNAKGQHSFPTLCAEASYSGDVSVTHKCRSTEQGNFMSRYGENGNEVKVKPPQISAKLTVVDIYESSRYDTFLLQEDLKNTDWLHSVDDKSEQGGIFDNGFELLPEPF